MTDRFKEFVNKDYFVYILIFLLVLLIFSVSECSYNMCINSDLKRERDSIEILFKQQQAVVDELRLQLYDLNEFSGRMDDASTVSCQSADSSSVQNKTSDNQRRKYVAPNDAD